MKVLVVHCHPLDRSFVAAAGEAARAGLRTGGHEVRVADLYAEGFRAELSEKEWIGHADGVRDEDAHPHIDALRWAEALVLVYPTWWGSQPAMLKGWLDRIWATGVAYDLVERRKILGWGRTVVLRGRLRNLRRIVAVTTHGSPRHLNMVQGEPGKALLLRGLRGLIHPRARVRWLAFYGADTRPVEDRVAYLRSVERRLSAPGL